MKITHEIAEKYRIKQEIKQTDYKGFVTEGVMQLADVIEEKIILMDYHNANKENWQDWMRVFVYEYHDDGGGLIILEETKYRAWLRKEYGE
ncbi:hypothetical protein VVB72_09480 [Lactococcus lactis subsp. lactis]|nr:hypothetical protein VVB72_09480 [Lactococcus lactis subsp. lactis]